MDKFIHYINDAAVESIHGFTPSTLITADIFYLRQCNDDKRINNTL